MDGFSESSINQHSGNIAIPLGDGPIYIGAFSRQNEIFSEQDRNLDGLIDEIHFQTRRWIWAASLEISGSALSMRRFTAQSNFDSQQSVTQYIV